MSQITLNNDWVGADPKVLKVEKHENLAAGTIIAYQPVLSCFPPHDISWYHCILKDHKKSRYMYHIGTIKKDLSSASYDNMVREYQLNNRGFWWQKKPPEGSPRSVQWADWIWKNPEEERMFKEWFDRHFEEKIPEEKRLIEKSEKIQPEQLTLF